jgi:YD repeat-containing protein
VGHSSVRRVAPAFSGISDSEILISSDDGAELYVFDGVGRHLQTLDGTTGAVLYRFVYDAAGRLKEVHDPADAVTQIERDKAGRPHAVIGPDGKRTTLETGKQGYLSRIAFPAGETVEMEYDNNAGGLLTSFKDAQGHVTHFRYDDAGNLLKE